MAVPCVRMIFLLVCCIGVVADKTGLRSSPSSSSGATAAGAVSKRTGGGGAFLGPAASEEIMEALEEVLGCGPGVSEEHMEAIKRALLPMWQTMPKNGYGRVERRSLRYLTHRYFNHQQSLSVRGFEPDRPSLPQILSTSVPANLERLLEGQASRGFTFEDVVKMVATLEQLIWHNESALLETVYKHLDMDQHSSHTHEVLTEVLETYMIHWMLGEDTESINELLANRTLLEESFPHWHDLSAFASGQVKSLEFAWQNKLRPKHGRDMLMQEYSFDDAHEVVGSITKSFGSYWDSECRVMKDILVDMDQSATGRVQLSDFYRAALQSDWRFGESEAYLRDLGVLDETSSWHGKQVIISNYIQAASNCIVATPYYMVCCANECQGILGEIEAAIGAPLASPSKILQVVGNLTLSASDAESPVLTGQLTEQLEKVAATHGGQVPIHGRLFAQWLHYVFPRECTFPHKTGTTSTAAPAEYQGEFVATREDMEQAVKVGEEHASGRKEQQSDGKAQEQQWMSQWSPDEELISDYNGQLAPPWECHWMFAGVSACILAAAFAFALYAMAGGGPEAMGSALATDSNKVLKSHMV